MQESREEILIVWNHILETVIGYGPNVAAAFAILVLGWILAGWGQKLVRRGLSKMPNLDATLAPMIASSVRYIILIFTMVAVLSRFGVETTSIIAVLGAAGLAIGLALQGTLQNVAAGFMLLMLRPFRVGDFIDAGGVAGTVEEINLFSTDMQTVDGVYMAVPNSSLWNTSITNFSRNPTRRINLPMGVSYDDDISRAREILLALMANEARVLSDPAPQTMVSELAASSVTISMRCWVSSDDYWAVLFELNEKSKQILEAAGMSIPYPQQDIYLHQVDKK